MHDVMSSVLFLLFIFWSLSGIAESWTEDRYRAVPSKSQWVKAKEKDTTYPCCAPPVVLGDPVSPAAILGARAENERVPLLAR